MDYQAIIDNITEDRARKILTKLDIDFEDKGNYLLMPTYCHNHKSDEASKKLYYYFNNKIFMCYTECGGMSWFKFLNHYYEAQGIAYDFYNDIYCLLVDETSMVEGFTIPEIQLEKTYTPTEIPQLPIFDSSVLDCFTTYYTSEWLNDGITRATMDKYNIKYDSVRNHIIIPHYDINNNLIGIRARALNEEDVEQYGKYTPICIENKWYSHPLSLNVYGLNNALPAIEKYGRVFIAESEKSVLQTESFDIPHATVAICGSSLNKYALLTIMRACPNLHEIVLCLDNEELPHEEKYYNKLRGICDKYRDYCNFSFIYDCTHLTRSKDSPFDNGEKIFRELYQHRVKCY